MANISNSLDFLPNRIEDQPNYFTITPGDVPVRNVVPTEKQNNETETWSGWLKVEVPSRRMCRICAMVDDNGSFTINGVTTEIAAGEHGARRYTPDQEVELEPGYYFVNCRLQDLTPLHSSYPNVKHFQAFIKWDDNGNEVIQEVTQLYNITEKGLRNVTIVITSKILGYFKGAKTYPYLMTYVSSGAVCLYDVPIYELLVKGRNNNGEYIESSFECLRFMPYLPEPVGDPELVKMEIPLDSMVTVNGSLGIYPSIYDETYRVHSNSSAENGGIVLYNNYLIHDGPDDDEDIFGGAGCVEICGKNGYSSLIETLMGLTGSTSSDRKTNLESIMNHQKLLVLIEDAETPELVMNHIDDCFL